MQEKKVNEEFMKVIIKPKHKRVKF
jgi:hypothetical protein